MGRGTFAVIMLGLPACAFAQPTASSLADLSLEELANLQVTSVSRRAERLADAPASIYVITADDIRRSGASSLPEALRLAPNLQVARIDASQYAISARGFNNAIGNKLLVLIDGRTVYTPLFSGVFWDLQDVMLEDVERIEVISGPGRDAVGRERRQRRHQRASRAPRGIRRALWCPPARATTEAGVAARYGGALGEQRRLPRLRQGLRACRTPRPGQRHCGGRRPRLRAGRLPRRLEAGPRRLHAAGRRLQRQVGGPRCFAVRVRRRADQGRIETSGANLLARWTRQLDASETARCRPTYDRTERDDINLFYRPIADIFDVEFQHGFRARRRTTESCGAAATATDATTMPQARRPDSSGSSRSSRNLDWCERLRAGRDQR